MDRVQVIKQESSALGGDDADASEWGSNPIEPQEDAVEAAGVYLQDVSNRDETTLLSRAGLDMLFKDGNNPTAKTLTELLAGAGGLTETTHEALDTLTHDINETSFEEYLYTGTRIDAVTVWQTDSKLKKVREQALTYVAGKVSSVVSKQYAVDGSTIVQTLTETYSYVGNLVDTIDRVLV